MPQRTTSNFFATITPPSSRRRAMSGDGDFPAVYDEADEKSLKSLIHGKKRPRENGLVSKPVAPKKEEPRREEDEDEDDIDDKPLAALGNGGRVIKEEPLGENGKEGRALGRMKTAKVKKEERVEEEEELEEKKALSNGRKVTTKIEKKEKKSTTRKVKKEKAEEELKGKGAGKKEKKAYEMPGQKHDPPENRDPSRIFYESLHKQIPGSEMAAIWMMERGLLPREEAQKVYSGKCKKNQEKVKLVESVTTKETVAMASKSKTKVVSKLTSKSTKSKRKSDDNSEDEDDFVPEKKIGRKKTST